MRSRDPLLWLVRLAWLALPFATGGALGRALDDASRPVQLVASIGLWAGWAVGLVATLVALPIALTVVRVLAPASLTVVLAAAVDDEPDALAAVVTAVLTVAAFAPVTAEHFVNGPAYGDERRYTLRVPGLLLLGPIEVTWALTLAALASGPLLLAARQWLLGAGALIVGLPLAALLLRSLHSLARRWLVFVPAGVVIHDPLTLVDPVLFRRSTIARFGPAPADTKAVDLTQRAVGLGLEVAINGPFALALVRPGRREADTVETDRVLVTPSRPGAVMAEAARRRFRVG